MTVAIPEAVGVAERAAAGRAAASRGGGKVVQGRVEGSTYELRNPRTVNRRTATGPRTAPRTAAPQAPPVGAPRTGRRRGGSRTRIAPGGRNYQGVILAEFLVAVIVVAFLPLASGPADGKQGPSPYRVNDMIQLVAIGAVYFVLALFSSGERSGRIVAWFGGLLTIGILIAKVGSGQLSAAVSSVSGVDKATLDNNP
jgi:hypothetical protein